MRWLTGRLRIWLAVATGVATLSLALHVLRNRQEEAHRELVTLAEGIDLGDSRSQVVARARTLRRGDVITHSSGALVIGDRGWPSNWVVWVELADGRVSSVRFRLVDGREYAAPGAPEDRE